MRKKASCKEGSLLHSTIPTFFHGKYRYIQTLRQIYLDVFFGGYFGDNKAFKRVENCLLLPIIFYK